MDGERCLSGTAWHTALDVLAWVASACCIQVLRRTWFRENPVPGELRFGYVAAVLFGAGAGAWVFGTANLWLTGIHEFGRSIEGALAGAILAIELYKKVNGVTSRTGAIYALPLALGIAVGRIGCLLAGLDDQTYGIPTNAGWGWDFGDGVPRHPVQLYESLAMAGFALVYAFMMARRSAFWHENGFYLAVGFYAVQRMVWEFLKPYDPVIAGLTTFQLLSIALIAYAGERMLGRRWR
jgi:prolipoprotein diacylglyceryltransferase